MQIAPSKKAQAAIEYLTTIGFALVVLMGLTIFAYNYTLSARLSSNTATASATVNNIIETANLVYAQGYPAKATIVAQIPENTISISFSGNSVIMTLRIKTKITNVAGKAKGPLVGSLPTSKGFYKVSIQSFGSYVNVTRIT